MITQISNNIGVLRDTRVLEENGRVMHVNLVLQMTSGQRVVVNRYFIKSNLTCEELLEQTDSTTVKRYIRVCGIHTLVQEKTNLIQTSVWSLVLSVSHTSLLLCFTHFFVDSMEVGPRLFLSCCRI